MPEQFDAYYKWLGIPPKDQPPNHYRLLGIELFESHAEVIEASAERQATYLHEVSAGPNVKESQKLLNEIAAARLCLLDPEKKATYDTELRSKVPASVAVDALPGSPLDDLPWDNLESLMTNGSSSDTTPKAEAASETLRLPAAGSSGIHPAPHSSGVFSAPQSLTAAKPKPKANTGAKSSKPRILWLAVGGGAIVIVGAIVAAILLNSGGPDNELAFTEQPPRENPKDTTPQKTEKKDGQSDKKDDKVQQPVKTDKKDDTKEDDGKGTQPKGVDNGNKEPVTPPVKPKGTDDQTGNSNTKNGNTKNGTDTKNGTGEKTSVVKKPTRSKEFHALDLFELVSTTGTTNFTVLDDKSVLAENVLAEGDNLKDVYEFQMKTDIPDLTAVRIEALPVDERNDKGPGHGKDGGYAIVEIRVAVAPGDNPTKSKVIELSGAQSNEAPKIIEKVIDGEDVGFWPVRNGAKKSTLTLFMKNEVRFVKGTLLYVQIAQREKLGRFRVSVSNDPALAGVKTRIEAELPLFVNLGAATKMDAARRNWQASSEFEGGEFGHIGGTPMGNNRDVPLTSCVSGIKEFRVTLPDGKYDVVLLFSGHCLRDSAQRSFEVVASGVEKKKFRGMKKSQAFIPCELKGVEAKGGGLTIQFAPEKGEPFLNGIVIDYAKK